MTASDNVLIALIAETVGTGSKERRAGASILLRILMGSPATAILPERLAVVEAASGHKVATEIRALMTQHHIRCDD